MDLKLTIEADLNDAKSNLELLKKELSDLKQSLSNNDRAIAGVNKQLAGLNTNTKDGAKAAAGLKTQLAALATTNSTLVQGITQVKEEIASESANIKALGKDLKSAETGGNAFAKGIGKAYGGLKTLANLIPGIGIGGLIGLIAGPLVEALESLVTSSNKAGEALAETFNDAGGAQGGAIARLQALVSIAQDATKSDSARKEALGALNKEYDAFNGKLTLANINTKYATDLINKQTDSLIRQAQIKGVQDLITEETKKQTKLLTSDVTDNLSLFDKFVVAVKGAGSIGEGAIEAVNRGIKSTNKSLGDSKKNVDLFKDALKGLLSQEADAGTLFEEPKPAAAKKIKQKIAKALKFSKEDLSKLFFDEATIKLQVPASVEIDFKKSLRDNPFKDEGLNGILGPEALKELQAKGELAGMGITTGIQDGLKTSVDGLRFPELIVLADDAKKKLAEFNESLTGIVQGTVTDIFAGIGESLGSGENLFGGFLKALGSGLKTLGTYMISVSAIVKGIKTAIKSLNPALLLFGGIALVAIGAALSKAKIPGFASGVTNFSGGLAVVGERGPELVRLPRGSDVIPNHLIGGVGQASASVFIPDIKVKGTDLVVVFNRASATIGRNG